MKWDDCYKAKRDILKLKGKFPNYYELEEILATNPDLEADFADAAEDPDGHEGWYRKVVALATPMLDDKAKRRKEALTSVGEVTPEAKKLRSIFKAQTEGEPLTARQAQMAVQKLGITAKQLAELEVGLDEADEEAEDDWQELRWRITDLVDNYG